MNIQSYGRWYLAVDANGLASLFANKPTRIRTVWVANGQSFTLSPNELDSLLTKINAPAMQWTDKGIKKDSIVRILGITQTDYLRSGELLWKRPQKQAITKAEIAEKLGMNVQDFEIIDEDNEENE